MKQNIFQSSVLVLMLVIFLIRSSQTSARKYLLAVKEGEADVKIISSTKSSSVAEMETVDSFNQLMGVEESCEHEDEECLKRRVVAEAHLDYIYTQQHKP